MGRHICQLLVIVVAVTGVPARADEPSAEAAAVDQAMRRVVARVEPSIACILVSRSDAYHKLFGEPASKTPGQLGAFPAKHGELRLPPADNPEVAALTRQLRKQPRGFDPADLQTELLQILKARYDLSDPNYVPASYGSGVVIDRDGLVLTYYHVIREATKLYVRLAGHKGSYADIFAADPISDLAVLKLLDRSVLPLEPVARGNGSPLHKGQLVLTMVFPFTANFRNARPIAAQGIVSAIRYAETRSIVDDWEEADLNFYRFGTLVQTDARMSTSCSGGALLDLEGRLVGLTTAVGGTTGVETASTLAVPFDADKWRLVNVLAHGEEAEHGFLGINFGSRGFGRWRRMRPQREGPVQVGWVLGNSPASRAGLRPGDTIVAINGQPVSNIEDARRAIGSLLAGSQARLRVISAAGDEHEVVATLTKAYHVSKGIASHRPPFAHGLRVDYTSVLTQRYTMRNDRIADGVVVVEVAPGSSSHAELHDARITKVNGRLVNAPAEFYEAVRQADRQGRPIELTIADPSHFGADRTVVLH